MVELERYGQSGLKPSLTISTPYQERIIELATILVYYAFYLCLYKGRCANNHVVVKASALAFISCLLREHKVVAIELLYVIGERNVAGADASLAVLYNDVDGKLVVVVQPPVYRQRIELLHLARRLTYAPAHQHGELHATPFADLYQAANIQRLHQCYHRHGR